MADPASGDDWFELFNPQALPVLLGGSYPYRRPYQACSLSNSSSLVYRSQGSRISSVLGGWDPGKRPIACRASNFLKKEGVIALYNGATLIDRINFGTQNLGISQGRLPDGSSTGTAYFPNTSTPGESNFLPLNTIWINEILTHTDPPLEDAIELYNPTTNAISIGGWYLSDSPEDWKKYRIADGTKIQPLGYYVFYEGPIWKYQCSGVPDSL